MLVLSVSLRRSFPATETISSRQSILPSSHRKFLLLITRGLDDDGASGAIDGETHPVGDTLSRLWYADDRRDAILAGHDSAMRHRSTHFHHQATSSEEEGCPARVGRGRDQDLSVFQASALGIEDHPCGRGHDPWRGRCPLECTFC